MISSSNYFVAPRKALCCVSLIMMGYLALLFFCISLTLQVPDPILHGPCCLRMQGLCAFSVYYAYSNWCLDSVLCTTQSCGTQCTCVLVSITHDILDQL